MVKIRGSKKRKLSKKNVNFEEIGGNARCKFCGIGEFINFVEIGEYVICIINLGGCYARDGRYMQGRRLRGRTPPKF